MGNYWYLYQVLRYPQEQAKQKIRNIRLIYFYTLNPYCDNALFLDPF